MTCQAQRPVVLNSPSSQKLIFGRITAIAIPSTAELSKARITEEVRKSLVFSQKLLELHSKFL